MNVKKYEFTDEERAEILGEYELSHPAHVWKRLLALKLKAVDAMRSDETAKIVGICHSSVNNIVKRYKKEGMKAIVGKRHNSGNRYMTFEEEAEFLKPFVEQGAAGRIVEVTEIYNAYLAAIGRPATRNALYYLLKKHGWRKIMPRGRHPKKASEEAIEAYKKNQ